MDKKPPRTNYSIDGFVPRPQNRHVDAHRLDPAYRSVPSLKRRPAFHTPQTQPQPQLPKPALENRTNLSDLDKSRAAAQPEKLQVPRHRLARRRKNSGEHAVRQGKLAAMKSRLAQVNWKKATKRTALVLGVLVLVCGGWLGWKIFHDSSKVFGGGSNLLGFFNATKLKGEDQGRVNILLTGVSTDDPGHDGANLTDSIMIVSLDTKNNKAQLISIPRDLWVNIPGYGYSKINAANAYGDESHFSEAGYPKGGVGLLEKVLSQDLGLQIQYYAKIDYTAIRDAVNAVGGITVNVKSDDPRGLYDPSIDWKTNGPLVNLTNGNHELNGEQALDLARARGDAYGSYGFPQSDFDRTNHQQQMLVALKNKAASASVLTNPIKLGQLFDAFGNHVKTNFKTSEVRRLYDLSKKLSSKNIQSISLNDANGKNLLSNYTSPDGESALTPAAGLGNYGQIQLFLKQLMSHDPVVRESANVVILNGGNLTGLASRESNVLTSKGMNVVAVADAPATAQTTIIDNSKGKMPNTKKALQKLFGDSVSTKNTYGYPTADFIVVLGANQPDVTTSSAQPQ